MRVGSSGGGFFFKSFSKCESYQGIIAQSGLAAWAWGPWDHLPFPKLTKAGRWMTINAYWLDGTPRTGFFQIGVGAVGAETIFLPSNYSVNAANGNRETFYYYVQNYPATPLIFNEPFAMPAGLDLSVRHMDSVAGVKDLHVDFYLWD